MSTLKITIEYTFKPHDPFPFHAESRDESDPTVSAVGFSARDWADAREHLLRTLRHWQKRPQPRIKGNRTPPAAEVVEI